MRFLPSIKLGSQFEAVLRVQLAIFACISLLQMPVPVVHSHQSFGDEGQLVEHLEKYHASSSAECDFHWHFMLPGEFPHEDSQDGGPPVRPNCLLGQIFSCSQFDRAERPLVKIFALDRAAPLFRLSSSASVNGWRREIYEPFMTPADRMRALLCVMLC